MPLCERVAAAIGRGTRTSVELARLFGTTQARMSVMLAYLAERGVVERGPAADRAAPGRPCIRWRRVERRDAA